MNGTFDTKGVYPSQLHHFVHQSFDLGLVHTTRPVAGLATPVACEGSGAVIRSRYASETKGAVIGFCFGAVVTPRPVDEPVLGDGVRSVVTLGAMIGLLRGGFTRIWDCSHQALAVERNPARGEKAIGPAL